MGAASPVQAIKLDECGLVRLFGELEARIMEAVWTLEKGTIREICYHMGENCHYKTVMTVANRLVAKGALERHRQGRAFVYTPCTSRDDFLEDVSRQMVTGLVQDFGTAAIAGFIKAVEQVAPDHLQAMRCLIDERLEKEI